MIMRSVKLACVIHTVYFIHSSINTMLHGARAFPLPVFVLSVMYFSCKQHSTFTWQDSIWLKPLLWDKRAEF